MILCFSGLGNTAYASRLLSKELGDEVRTFSADELRHPDKIQLKAKHIGKRIIWAFPTYGWQVPPVMERIIQNIPVNLEAYPHYMFTTCGDDMGIMDKHWAELINSRGWVARGAYAVKMPNTYVFLPGFDVDSLEVEQSKLEAAPARVREIAELINKDSGDALLPGSFPKVKSDVLGPVFRKMYMSPKPFHSTDACVGCGLCAKSCPMENITMLGGHPNWSVNCAFCLRCYHICPHHAVAYGRQTSKKGRYTAMLKFLGLEG